MIKHLLYFLLNTTFWIIIFPFSWCRHIKNNDITNSQNYIWRLITNKHYYIHCW